MQARRKLMLSNEEDETDWEIKYSAEKYLIKKLKESKCK
jgi:hypothetical protein